MSPKRKSLSAEDQALWEAYAADLVPLKPTKKRPAPAPTRDRDAPRSRQSPATLEAPEARRPALPTMPDRKASRAVATGKVAIDRKLDLHGMTQVEAHEALRRAIADGRNRRLLVVTGRGVAKSGGGILRANVPRWLAEPEFARRVHAIGPAAKRHGGDGAYYVFLRKGDKK